MSECPIPFGAPQLQLGHKRIGMKKIVFLIGIMITQNCYAKPKLLEKDFSSCDELVSNAAKKIAAENNHGKSPTKVIFVKLPSFHKLILYPEMHSAGDDFVRGVKDVPYYLMYSAIVHTEVDGLDVCNEVWFPEVKFKNNVCDINEKTARFKEEVVNDEDCELTTQDQTDATKK